MRSNSFTIALALGLTLISSACTYSSDSSTRGDTADSSSNTTSFDLCEHISADFLTKHGFEVLPSSSRSTFVLGPNKGSDCSLDAEDSYHVIVAATDAPVELGVATQYSKLVYEPYTISGRPAEIARAQNQSNIGGSYVSSESCELNVKMINYLVTFYFTNHGLSETRSYPCEKLTDIASEVVTMLPPEK